MSDDAGRANSLGARLKGVFSIPNAIGMLINFVVVLKIIVLLQERDFSGISGKIASFYVNTENDLINALASIFRWTWLKTFLTYNLDTLIICALLLFMSLRSSIKLMKHEGIRSVNGAKINDAITIAFFVTFCGISTMLLNQARGCTGVIECNILTHNTIAPLSTSTYILPGIALFIASNAIAVPVLFIANKISVDLRIIAICYGSIIFQLFVFSLVTLFTLLFAGL